MLRKGPGRVQKDGRGRERSSVPSPQVLCLTRSTRIMTSCTWPHGLLLMSTIPETVSWTSYVILQAYQGSWAGILRWLVWYVHDFCHICHFAFNHELLVHTILCFLRGKFPCICKGKKWKREREEKYIIKPTISGCQIHNFNFFFLLVSSVSFYGNQRMCFGECNIAIWQ